MTHSDTAKPIAAVIDLPPLDGEPSDLEAKSELMIAEARKADARARLAAMIKHAPNLAETDWNHAGLAYNKEAIGRVLDWQYGAKGLLIAGPTGRGKTRAVYGLLRRLVDEQGRGFRFWHSSDWFRQLQAQVQYGRDEAWSWVEATASHSLVVMDDFGQEAVDNARQNWAMAWFFRFLDIRLAKALPFIVTTNLTAKQMSRATGPAEIRHDPLLRRLLELCGEPVVFKGKADE